jgi:hypothetical protein
MISASRESKPSLFFCKMDRKKSSWAAEGKEESLCRRGLGSFDQDRISFSDSCNNFSNSGEAARNLLSLGEFFFFIFLNLFYFLQAQASACAIGYPIPSGMGKSADE